MLILSGIVIELDSVHSASTRARGMILCRGGCVQGRLLRAISSRVSAWEEGGAPRSASVSLRIQPTTREIVQLACILGVQPPENTIRTLPVHGHSEA